MGTVKKSRIILSLAIWLTVCAFVLISVSGVRARPSRETAQSFTVNTTSDASIIGGCLTEPTCSLRDAILAANSQPGPDDIILPSGIYTLSSKLPLITTVITVTGEMSNTTIIDGNNAFRVMHIEPAGEMVLKDVTIRNGRAVADPGGGAVTNRGTLVLQHCLVRDNVGISKGSVYNNGGGGILNWYGELSVVDSELIGNVSVSNSSHNGSNGSAIYNQLGTVTIADSSISGNSAQYSGAIHNNGGIITVTNSLIADNVATNGNGGGFLNSCGTLRVADSTISHNTAGWAGGGILHNCGDALILNSRLVDNILSNSSGRGGGIRSSGILTMQNSVISGNYAPNTGGGLHLEEGALYYEESYSILINNQITDNHAGYDGGGIYLETEDLMLSGGGSTLINNLVADNWAGNHGSGLYIRDSMPRLLHTTIASNHGGDGSGLFVVGNNTVSLTIPSPKSG